MQNLYSITKVFVRRKTEEEYFFEIAQFFGDFAALFNPNRLHNLVQHIDNVLLVVVQILRTHYL